MKSLALPVFNTEGKEVDSLKLDPAVFDGTVNEASIYQAVNAYRAAQRAGTAATRTRGEVSGGGRKPWKQKGTGRARVGSTRSPLWRHGGVVFGPHPRDFSFEVPKKIKSLALKSALNAKLKEHNLIVLDDLKVPAPKTKEAARILANLKIRKSVLFLLDKIEKNEHLALRNIASLNYNLARDTNAYEVLSHSTVVVTRGGLQELAGRLKRKEGK